jgi:3-oxoacyl-[acyl-carrier-protein] synthase-3
VPEERVPMTIEDMGNCGGPSVAVAMTQKLPAQRTATQTVMLLGYGVGLSWGAAVVNLDPRAELLHAIYSGEAAGSDASSARPN